MSSRSAATSRHSSPRDLLQWESPKLVLHPGRLTWNVQLTDLERKIILQTSVIMFHVNLPGCTLLFRLQRCFPRVYMIRDSSILKSHCYCCTACSLELAISGFKKDCHVCMLSHMHPKSFLLLSGNGINSYYFCLHQIARLKPANTIQHVDGPQGVLRDHVELWRVYGSCVVACVWMCMVFCFASAKFGCGGLLVPSKKWFRWSVKQDGAAFTGNAQWGPYGP